MEDRPDLSDTYFLEYEDRKMKKWMTAFALGELTVAITKGKQEAMKNIPRLPQQELTYIERCLERSIAQNKVLEIQLNSRDHLGRVKDHVFGTFRGFADLDTAVINSTKGEEQYDQYIDFTDIRHVIIHNFTKWSSNQQEESDNPYEDVEFEIAKDIEDFCDEYFNDGDFIE